MGWSSVASETGQAIADEAKQKIEELSASGGEQGMRELFKKKMVYLMNDPAINEMKSSQFGVFKWPCGDDVGIVSRRSVLEINVPYKARGSGQSWFVKNAQEIQEKFQNM